MFRLNQFFIMPRYRSLCWIFGLLLLAGCSSEPVKKPLPPPAKTTRPLINPLPAAEPLKSSGLTDNQDNQHLLAAETKVQAGDYSAAHTQLDLVHYASLSAEQRSKFNLLAAEVSLSMADFSRALSQLEMIRPKLLNNAEQINYFQSLAFAHALAGNILPSINARIRLGYLLSNLQQQQDNRATILDILTGLSLDTLSMPPADAEELGGWMALAKIVKQRGQSGFDFNQQLLDWQQAYRQHAANNAEFIGNYLHKSTNLVANPTPAAAMIAVLLPASGNYAAAGKAIKDGILAAQRQAAVNSPQLPLRFYDSEQGDIGTIYRQAVADGASQIIGPLVKEQIQNLAEQIELSVPVLALNHVENLNRNNLYQFGLSPIDEAGQLSLKAHQDGGQTAMILVPNSGQGQRIGHYLTSAWQSQGGIVLGVQSYDPKQHDIANILNGFANSTPAENTAKPVQTLFLSASPELARELAPALKNHPELTVYAMPGIYSGRPNPVQDMELGKINFCDIPWFFGDLYSGPLSQLSQQGVWQSLPDTQLRLLALGMDAYNVLGQLNQLATTPYNGATGHLSLNAENRLTRKLVCAQFKAGLPVASGFVE
ncbi:penicillin-binding protein activator [Methylomonas paludis]|uniref:Penicillin-binding protein activator n=2 Tax=Methylomonas paludis TaxID=1173101 RepID=A0A975R8U9_9GAMM|nr:penicillin-binding protein activator [Methylomonas paludis]